ncbi:hypothetical protein L9F63_000684, partial [Diploptera punctata]
MWVLQLWNTGTKKIEKQMLCYCYEQHKCTINTLIWHMNNDWCASGCSRGRLHVIKLDTSMRESIPLAHDGQICLLRSSADGCLLASSGEDGAVRVRSWKTLNIILEIRDHSSYGRAIAWHPWKASCLVIGGINDGTLSVWNVNTQRKEVQQLDPRAAIYSLEFNFLTGELVASVSMT